MHSLKDYLTAHPASPHFKKKFVSMWVAGTMGAYVTLLFRNLASDIPTLSIHQIAWQHTLDVLIRYAYLSWFLAYFFVSNVRLERNKENISGWDIWFDVTQATVGFGAAYFLGFLTRGADTPLSHSMNCAVVAANSAIATICTFSLISFGYPSGNSEEKRKLNRLRWFGLASSLLAAGTVIVASCIGETYRVLVWCAATLFGLVPFIALLWFVGMEWERDSTQLAPCIRGAP